MIARVKIQVRCTYINTKNIIVIVILFPKNVVAVQLFCFRRSEEEDRPPAKVMKPMKAMKTIKAMKAMKAGKDHSKCMKHSVHYYSV